MSRRRLCRPAPRAFIERGSGREPCVPSPSNSRVRGPDHGEMRHVISILPGGVLISVPIEGSVPLVVGIVLRSALDGGVELFFFATLPDSRRHDGTPLAHPPIATSDRVVVCVGGLVSSPLPEVVAVAVPVPSSRAGS